jgi:hypothetical protein
MSVISICMPEDLEQILRPVLERDPDKGTEWLKAGFEARLAELYQQWQALSISTARFAELLGVSPWELADLLRARGLKRRTLLVSTALLEPSRAEFGEASGYHRP